MWTRAATRMLLDLPASMTRHPLGTTYESALKFVATIMHTSSESRARYISTACVPQEVAWQSAITAYGEHKTAAPHTSLNKDEERLCLAAPTPKQRPPIQHERCQVTIDDDESGHVASPPCQQDQHFLLDTSVRGIPPRSDELASIQVDTAFAW
ncbi:hypothetical protein DL766_004607 [Monosporascus sp. MC13-8B]|nr:hypothetical protein DL763_006233 [Monosporascus cannonballus]RYP30993.1 hypothetical protein DL766_004607 [Monosporascus sp. MC13-8B]